MLGLPLVKDRKQQSIIKDGVGGCLCTGASRILKINARVLFMELFTVFYCAPSINLPLVLN